MRALAWSLAAVFSLIVAIVIFQTGMRYRYERLGGILWRVDQITNQRCRVLGSAVDCAPLQSTSTSTSKSTSTSLSVRAH
jgi:divalent metal cation (Fe/Co/Zn/Cd) transporter